VPDVVGLLSFKLVKKLVKTVTLMNRILVKGELSDDDENDTEL
jgi:hypothetical protein